MAIDHVSRSRDKHGRSRDAGNFSVADSVRFCQVCLHALIAVENEARMPCRRTPCVFRLVQDLKARTERRN